MPRTSARLKERFENKPSARNTPLQIVAKDSASRPHKKQKTKASVNGTPNTDSTPPGNYIRVKGKKGKLRNFMIEMPLDILFEVFGQLEPIDLLLLSRATKELRTILTASDTAFLWKKAYHNLNRPPPICPGVNLRHYTNFLYGRNCHFCGSVYGTILHYTARVRLCRICTTKHLMLKRCGITSIYQKIDLEREALSMCSDSFMSIPHLGASNGYVLKIEFEQKVRALQARKDDPVGLEDFYHEQYGLQLERRQYAGKIKQWYTRLRTEHATNLDECRKRRIKAISQRIHDEGYGKELSNFQITNLPGVKAKTTAELGDRAWEKIKPRLIAVLEYQRQENLKGEMICTFQTRIQQLSKIVTEFHSKTPQPFVIPPTVHFARTAPFDEIIKDTSIDQKVVANELRNLTSHIPHITVSWRKSADQCLLDLLPQKSTSRDRKGKGKGKEISTSYLGLATTFFKCYWCREPISYPRILMHKCLRHREFDDPEDEEKSEDEGLDTDEGDKQGNRLLLQEKTRQNVVDSVWSKISSWYGADWNEGDNQITFDDEASGFAQIIVKACGEDSNKVTFDRMNEIDARVECLRCRSRKKLVMNWTTAILHDLKKHFEKAPDEKGWQLLNKEDTIKAKDVEAELSYKWPDFRVKTPHNPELGSHFYLPLDTLIKRPPYAVRI